MTLLLYTVELLEKLILQAKKINEIVSTEHSQELHAMAIAANDTIFGSDLEPSMRMSLAAIEEKINSILLEIKTSANHSDSQLIKLLDDFESLIN